jgi:hypothetical protein
MSHPIYEEQLNPELLRQGDILNPIPLKPNLKGHQDYFASQPHFYRYMILTQTCDLTHMKKMPDFIFLAVIRKLNEAISARHFTKENENSTKQMLRDLFNHNYNKRGFFYLPENNDSGIEEDCLVDLRVMFSIHKSHYQDLVNARIGGITPLYASQLGHMVGHMFSKIAVPGWPDINGGQSADDKAKDVIKEFKQRENIRFEELRLKAQNRCVFSNCSNKPHSFRWVNVRLRNQETKYIECVICLDHIKQWDDGSLPVDTKLRVGFED